MTYSEKIIAELEARYPEQAEFIQAAKEVLETLQPALDAHPEYEENALLERLVEPERVVMFRVPWVDDEGKVQVNRGYRVEFNSAIGPYKGGLRFNPTVTVGMLKFLGFEQIFKNSLTDHAADGRRQGRLRLRPQGQVQPRGHGLLPVVHDRALPPHRPQHRRPRRRPGRGRPRGGLHVRPVQAPQERVDRRPHRQGPHLRRLARPHRGHRLRPGLLRRRVPQERRRPGDSFEGKKVVVHGSGNVAIYAIQKVSQLGGTVVACSDTKGWVEDPDGIDYQVLEHIYNKKRSGHDQGVSLAMYVDERPGATWHEGDGRGVWQLPCDIALPCARENTLHLEDAKALVANGCKVVGEGANMPTTPDATAYLMENGVAFMPGKAANAGGVLVSGLEMSQNAEHLSWTFEEVDGKLESLMRGMFHNVDDTARAYGHEGNFVMGANIAGFLKVAEAMMAQGVC